MLNIENIIKNSCLEDMFKVDFSKEDWIWVNREIFFDIVYSILAYDTVEEDCLKEQIENTSDDLFIEILNSKFKEKKWILVDQRLFEKLVDDFKATKDIETFIYVNKKFYNKKSIEVTNQLNWILRAMAIDSYKYLALENKTLIQIYEEYFSGNSMIIEEILIKGVYKFHTATWKLNKKNNLLELYKIKERYSQWSEENAQFIFSELSK